MAVWLAYGSRAVGFDDGLIRADDFAHLVEAARLVESAAADRDQVLAVARNEAQALLESAGLEAQAILMQAQKRFEQAYRLGRDQGMQDAAAQWATQAISEAEAQRRHLMRSSARLAGVVSMAVERVIEREDRVGLFQRSLRTILRLVKDAPMVTLRVSESDILEARRAVELMEAQTGTAVAVEVLADAALPSGACRFESDEGVVDAGLETQLAALRRAVERGARQMVEGALIPEVEKTAEERVSLGAGEVDGDCRNG